ncbi:MAG: hypothetical protein ACRC1W_14285, partial [Shewanella sp.]
KKTKLPSRPSRISNDLARTISTFIPESDAEYRIKNRNLSTGFGFHISEGSVNRSLIDWH